MAAGKSSRLIGARPSTEALSSCTSELVARPARPNSPAAPFTPSRPRVFSYGNAPAVCCERTRRSNVAFCGAENWICNVPTLRVEPPRVHELRRRIRHCDTVRHGNGELAQLTLGQAYLKVVHSRHDPGCRDEELLELRVEHRLLDALVACLGFPVYPHIRLGRQHQIDRVDPVFRKCMFQRHGIRRGHFQFLSAHFQREEVYHRRLCWHGEAPHVVAVFHARLVLETDVVHTHLVCNKLLRCRLADRELRQLQFAVLEIDALQHRWRGEKLDAAAGLGLPLERAGKRHAAAGHLAALHHGEQPPAVRLGRLAKRRAGAQEQAKQDRRRSGGGRLAEPSVGLDGTGGLGGLGGSLRWAVTLGQATCTSTNRMASPAKQCRPLGTSQCRPGDEQPADQQAATYAPRRHPTRNR